MGCFPGLKPWASIAPAGQKSSQTALNFAPFWAHHHLYTQKDYCHGLIYLLGSSSWILRFPRRETSPL